MDTRDPLANPVPWDVVQGVWHKPSLHFGDPYKITCQAVIGNLVAFTTDKMNDKAIHWCCSEDWCSPDVWIREYKVLHRGDE